MTTTRQPVPALAPVAFLEGKEGHRMKPTRFPRELRLSIPRTCGTEVSHAAARGPLLTGALTCDSGSRAARSGFCQWPSGTPRASSSRPWSFFFCVFCRSGSACPIAGPGLPNRKPDCRNVRWHWRTPSLSRTPARSMPLASCLADFRASLASAEASLDSPKRCFSFSSLERPDCSPSRSGAGLCLRTCESNTRQAFRCASQRRRLPETSYHDPPVGRRKVSGHGVIPRDNHPFNSQLPNYL